ncbi:MAG: Ig domain-containing protein [Balneolaceae bacterium]
MKIFTTPFWLALLFLVIFSTQHLYGQWSQDFRNQMEIPEIINIHSSDTHLYALSEREGLVVFRAHADSLQWLYSSTGMQQRGHILEADIRFAYLYGNNRRLTVIEPTSVLGVYSSTILPERPRSVKRIEDHLYIALGNAGLGTLSLETPESVDSNIEFIDSGRFENSTVLDLATDQNRILYILSGSRNIDIYDPSGDGQTISHRERVGINRPVEKLFLTNNELYGSDNNGRIYRISSDGQSQQVAEVSGSVQKLQTWNDHLVLLTENNELWIGQPQGDFVNWKSNERAGNYFTVTENKLWVSESSQISPVIEQTVENNSNRVNETSEVLKLKPVDDVTLPFPRPLILPIELENRIASADVTFALEAPFDNARIRGNSLYWQPTATQTGRHQVEITAATSDGQSDRIEFTIDLRTFNAPPRFSPSRPVTIPIRETFQLGIKAVDPDGINTDLIRYLGVDMPEGARLNEQSGLFSWTPNIRQVGSHTFQVIATDQYGAAASQDFEIRVVEIEEPTPEDEN